MPQDYLQKVYDFSHAERVKTILIVLAKIIDQLAGKGLDQPITIKDSMKRIYNLFSNEVRLAAQLSNENYLKNAYEWLEESQEHFQRANIDEALLMITKAISAATTQASYSLKAIEQEP